MASHLLMGMVLDKTGKRNTVETSYFRERRLQESTTQITCNHMQIGNTLQFISILGDNTA